MNYNRLNKFSNMVTNKKNKKPTVVFETLGRFRSLNDIDINIDVEHFPWKIKSEMENYIDELVENKDLNFEEKILNIYLKLCRDYIYDDNILSYLQIKDHDVFALPEFYGKNPTEEWNINREKHNKRVCFEISRILVKSLEKLIEKSDNSDKYDACILWDKDLVHYNVGLTSDDYSLILDLDDFEKIKDLSRIKMGLTAEGIEILDDKNGKFKNVLDNYNKTKINSSMEQVSQHLSLNLDDENKSVEEMDYDFLKCALEVIKDEYDLDSAGIFEYMKEIVDTRLGSEYRQKVWKEITLPNDDNNIQNNIVNLKDNSNIDVDGEKIYTRCIVATIGNKKYLIDVTAENSDSMIFPVEEKDFEKLKIIPSLHRSHDEMYSGR